MKLRHGVDVKVDFNLKNQMKELKDWWTDEKEVSDDSKEELLAGGIFVGAVAILSYNIGKTRGYRAGRVQGQVDILQEILRAGR